jgi:hypothetical protein
MVSRGERMFNWKPIDTAPKDGTYILVWGEDFDCPMTARWEIINEREAVLNDAPLRWGWGGHGYIFNGLTHWMPAPKAPLPGVEVKNG